MQIKVFSVRVDSKGFHIAHVQFQDRFADCLATPDVTGPGIYELKSTLRVRDGKLIPLIRVEKP